jgi:DUF1365 family protein
MAFDQMNFQTLQHPKENVGSKFFASAIYEGTVRHRRYSPRPNHFSYKVFMVYLDLQELDQVFAQSPWWSHKNFNLAWLKREDFATCNIDANGCQPLYDAVADIVENNLGERPEGPIRMLTNLRYFGFIVNPITCYYCFDKTGKHLQTIVAEVTNTPWRERCHYILPVKDVHSSKQNIHFAKTMHVSPFQPMDLEYRWRGKTPAKDLVVHIDVLKQDNLIFDATMILSHQPANKKTMNKFLLRYPFMTMKVFISIYWQALKLMIKKNPYYSNPKAKAVANMQLTNKNKV